MKRTKGTRIAIILAVLAVSVGVAFVVASPAQPAPQAAADDEGFEKLGPAKPGEWRSSFHEAPQSFEQYVAGPLNRRSEKRTTFYIQPLGGAATRYREMLERMRAHSEAYFGVPAKVLAPIPMIEETYRAERRQYNASQIIQHLTGQVPDDALVFIGITEKDLYSSGLNFVFGEASLHFRCGVYSLTRYETDDLPLFTRRSLQLASHESGHILSIHHCVTYSCVMQGGNSLAECDRQPLHLCPIDLQKVLWNTGVERNDRYRRLEALYREWGCKNEADWVSKRLGG
jgi:archaemetzincin